MASVVDICNLALARLADVASLSAIDPPEGSAQADHCEAFYPIARDTLLSGHNWDFATKKARLACLTEDNENRVYVYVLPSKCIKVIKIYSESDSEQTALEFTMEASDAGLRTIVTSETDVWLKYVERVEESDRFSPLFVDALAWLLASYLAGPIYKGESATAVIKQCNTMLSSVIAQAIRNDMAQQHVKQKLVSYPSWIRFRRGLNNA